jgi:SAM-dependent methyltransferase
MRKSRQSAVKATSKARPAAGRARKADPASPWDKWPKWTSDQTFSTPNFNFNCSVSDYTGKSGKKEIALLKDRAFLDVYRKLAANEKVDNVFEIGFFQGGMPLFLSDMIKPKRTVAVDWHPASPELMSILAEKNLTGRIELIGNIDQADTKTLRKIVQSKFGGEELDLIIDDCSHYYGNTKGCFEQLFGYLRPGGKYIIEDWGWTHWPGAPWQTKDSHFNGMPSMSNLVFEIIMAFASNKDLIASIELPTWACMVITKGGKMKHGAPLDLQKATNMAGGRSAPLIVEPAPAQVAESKIAEPLVERSAEPAASVAEPALSQAPAKAPAAAKPNFWRQLVGRSS